GDGGTGMDANRRSGQSGRAGTLAAIGLSIALIAATCFDYGSVLNQDQTRSAPQQSGIQIGYAGPVNDPPTPPGAGTANHITATAAFIDNPPPVCNGTTATGTVRFTAIVQAGGGTRYCVTLHLPTGVLPGGFTDVGFGTVTGGTPVSVDINNVTVN